MEPEGSWSCSQQPATCPDPQPDTSTPHPPILFFLGSLQCYASKSSKRSLSFSLQRSTSKPRTNFSYPPCVPHAYPSHPPGFEHPENSWNSSFCIFFYPPVISSFSANASSLTHYSRIPFSLLFCLCVINHVSPRITEQTKSQFKFADGKQASHVYWMARIYIIVQWRQSFSKF